MSMPPPIIQPSPPPLSEGQLRELAEARTAWRRIGRAVNYALFEGWSIAVFAALSLVCGLFSPAGFIIGLAMGAIAYVEITQAWRLKRLEPRAATVLGFNELAFAAVLIAYACWSLYQHMSGPGMYAEAIAREPQLAQMLEPIEHLVELVVYVMYGTLIAVAIFVQGGAAFYFFSRRKCVEAYRRETPAWILSMQQAGMTI